MSELQFLSTHEAATVDLPWPDVYFTPFYAPAVEKSEDAEWELALWTTGPILYPYLKRKVDPELDDTGLFDIVSPYGYSGTWAPPDLPIQEWQSFRGALREALRERGAVAEFQRISGLVPGRASLVSADPELEATHHNDTVAIDLSRGYEACWAGAEGRSRTKTRKARRLGYTWSCRPATAKDVAAGSTFRTLYEETMRRVDAAPYHFFPDGYYERLQAELDDNLYVLEVRSRDNQTVVAGIFLAWEPLLHLHLVGSVPQALRDGAGNLAYDGLIHWACEQGRFARLHIGGGLRRGDHLFVFKRSFGGEVLPFWTGRSVINRDRYLYLVRKYANTTDRTAQELLEDNFFPAYRSRGDVPAARIHLSPPHMSSRERELLLDAFDSNWIAPLGPHVDDFEREFAAKIGTAEAVALSSGTAALHLSLLLLGVGQGDEVLTSTLTFAATANAITYVGARPAFIDSDRETWNMDPDLLAEELEIRAKNANLPKAVIVVDLYGQCADYQRIAKTCRFYDVPLIEDAAEALGATYRERPAGSFGVLNCFSFNGNKIMTTSGGGMLACDRKDWAERARFLASQARDPAPYYEHSTIGYNYRMSNLLAAVGRGQLRMLDTRVDQRCANFDYYRQALADLPGISFMPEISGGRSTRWLTCITIDPDVFGATAEDMRLAHARRNIESRRLWKPMHLQPVFADCRIRGGAVAEHLFNQGLCLPSGSNMSDNDRNRVVETIRSVYAQRSAAIRVGEKSNEQSANS